MPASKPCLAACALLLAAASAPCLSQNQPLAQSANERFTALDANKDGVLSRYEYDANVVFLALDTNHDDLISPAELRPLLGSAATDELALDRVRVADRTADDMLDENELERATEMRFEYIDADHDGNVALEELQARFGQPMVSLPKP
jgi:Ca2+-binding EF-hand superfamily protein